MRYAGCLAIMLANCLGCGPAADAPREAAPAARAVSPVASPVSPAAPRPSPPRPLRAATEPVSSAGAAAPAAASPSWPPRDANQVASASLAAARFPRWAPPAIDAARAQAAGIRCVTGRHLTLYTDLAADPRVDELPAVFDAAIPQWCAYFAAPPERTRDWRLVAHLIRDKDRFRGAGLLPDDLPPFLNGYQRFAELWVYEQPSDYYRRHLLLHEGTHAFMNWALGGTGPPWYMEGTAELLATHQWRGGQLTLGWFPRDKEETPYLGRIKIVQDDIAADRGKTLEQVMQYDERAHLRVEPYAWCWAAAAFLDGQAACRPAFRRLREHVQEPAADFSQLFRGELSSQWNQIVRQWALFTNHLDYGYDLEREAIQEKPARLLDGSGATVAVAADRGWQSTGLQLRGGTRYRVETAGRFQVGDQPRVWWCEANGVTLRYYRGLPLGLLLGAILDDERAPRDATPLLRPDPLGAGGERRADRGGTLYLRVNDAPSELRDNAGGLTVTVRPLPD